MKRLKKPLKYCQSLHKTICIRIAQHDSWQFFFFKNADPPLPYFLSLIILVVDVFDSLCMEQSKYLFFLFYLFFSAIVFLIRKSLLLLMLLLLYTLFGNCNLSFTFYVFAFETTQYLGLRETRRLSIVLLNIIIAIIVQQLLLYPHSNYYYAFCTLFLMYSWLFARVQKNREIHVGKLDRKFT